MKAASREVSLEGLWGWQAPGGVPLPFLPPPNREVTPAKCAAFPSRRLALHGRHGSHLTDVLGR